MLEEITVENYTTYINSTTFDFKATNSKILEDSNVGSNRILKGCLFVGENASGKTQVLMAIKFLLDLLFNNNPVNFLKMKSFYTNKPNYSIKYVFNIDNKKIVYELKLKLNGIEKEVLSVDNDTIINRIKNVAEFYMKENKVFEDVSDTLSFLRRIYFDTRFYEDYILNKWFDYLSNSVYVNCYNRQVATYNSSELLVHDYLKNNDVKPLNDIFNKIGYNETIKYTNETPSSKSGLMIKSSDKFICFKKKDTDVYIHEEFESTGNKTLVELLPSIIHAINNDCIVILDEFSSGLHNQLEASLLRYFYENSKNSQLFFTSHSTNLLNNSYIRPDQIYSISFKGEKGSTIKRFSDESPRESQNIEKMYLNGVFDGMPKYKKVFQNK